MRTVRFDPKTKTARQSEGSYDVGVAVPRMVTDCHRQLETHSQQVLEDFVSCLHLEVRN